MPVISEEMSGWFSQTSDLSHAKSYLIIAVIIFRFINYLSFYELLIMSENEDNGLFLSRDL